MNSVMMILNLSESLAKPLVMAKMNMAYLSSLKNRSTEVQCISRNPPAVRISIENTVLKQVDQFTYLGGVATSDASCGSDIKRRIGLATGASASLSTIWAAKEISKQTKIRVYQSLVLSILLYNSETWTLRETDKRRLLVFEMTVLRRILGITRRDRWRNQDVRSQLDLARGCCAGDSATKTGLLRACVQNVGSTHSQYRVVWKGPRY